MENKSEEKEQVLIRRFEESDVDDVYETIFKSLYNNGLKKIYEPVKFKIWEDVYTPKYIIGLAKTKHFYVAVYKEKVVGCAAVSIVESVAFIECVYINTDYQGLGIGKKLITACEEDEFSKKAGKINLHAVLSAVKFYQKMGFHFEKECPEVIVDCGLEIVSMIKEL